jgi:hypothetical protein
MGNCAARPAAAAASAEQTRRSESAVVMVSPARPTPGLPSSDPRKKPTPQTLPLSPLDSALCVRGLVVHWAFMYRRDLDPALVRDALAAALVDFPVLAGRSRVKAQSGLKRDLEVVLNDSGGANKFSLSPLALSLSLSLSLALSLSLSLSLPPEREGAWCQPVNLKRDILVFQAFAFKRVNSYRSTPRRLLRHVRLLLHARLLAPLDDTRRARRRYPRAEQPHPARVPHPHGRDTRGAGGRTPDGRQAHAAERRRVRARGVVVAPRGGRLRYECLHIRVDGRGLLLISSTQSFDPTPSMTP